MQLAEVRSESDKKRFHRLPHLIYSRDQNWIAPLQKEIEKIFTPGLNTFFIDGDAVRFILMNGNNTVGRIAAFYSKKNLSGNIRYGGVGFFECVESESAATILFDAATKWLTEKGCNTIEGPVNFGQRDRYWGLLVDGFEPPLFGMNYHPPYYKKLFEAYGFQNYFEQYTFTLETQTELPAVVKKIKARLDSAGQITFKTPDRNSLEKFAGDFQLIYNQAWVNHSDVQPITEAQSLRIMEEVKPVMDPELLVFAYHGNEPVGFFISLPDINQLLKYANGKLNFAGKLNILLHKPFVRIHRLAGIIFGVIPKYQNKGIEAGLVATAQENMRKNRFYQQIELLWVGDFNQKMLKFVGHINAKKYRTFITYRKILDEKIPFKRAGSV